MFRNTVRGIWETFQITRGIQKVNFESIFYYIKYNGITCNFFLIFYKVLNVTSYKFWCTSIATLLNLVSGLDEYLVFFPLYELTEVLVREVSVLFYWLILLLRSLPIISHSDSGGMFFVNGCILAGNWSLFVPS